VFVVFGMGGEVGGRLVGGQLESFECSHAVAPFAAGLEAATSRHHANLQTGITFGEPQHNS
jgi:hypothetical protein